MTKFTKVSITPEQAFRLILEAERESADASREQPFHPYDWTKSPSNTTVQY